MEQREELKDLEAEDEYGDEGERGGGGGKNQRQKNYHHYHNFWSGQKKRGLIKIFP